MPSSLGAPSLKTVAAILQSEDVYEAKPIDEFAILVESNADVAAVPVCNQHHDPPSMRDFVLFAANEP